MLSSSNLTSLMDLKIPSLRLQKMVSISMVFTSKVALGVQAEQL